LATLERHGPNGFDFVFIDETRGPISVGKSPDNDLVLDGDDAVSRLHAKLERLGPAWCITDLGARNGTIVNGALITSRKLYDGDEIILGRTKLVLRDSTARKGGGTTRPLRPAPTLTKTEKLVLIELCRPMLSGRAFNPPARVETIANALFVGQGAVRQHLGHLYDKFGIENEPGLDKRLELANAAIQSGAVTRKDLEGTERSPAT
jgi:pSer/pThr/pTyr-binding forkhead associated (FHA) protein